MVSLLCLNALCSAYATTVYKVIGELFTDNAMQGATLLIITLLIIAVAGNILQMHLTNLAMKYYDQIEVVPIWYTTLTLAKILCGFIFLNEIAYYNTQSLICIIASALSCTIGIMILVKKNSHLQNEKQEEQEPSYIDIQKAKVTAGSVGESERL